MGKGTHSETSKDPTVRKRASYTSCFGSQTCHHPVLAPGLSPPPKSAGKPSTNKNEYKKQRLKDAKSLPTQKCKLFQSRTLGSLTVKETPDWEKRSVHNLV